MSANPYAAPQTPSDQIWVEKKIKLERKGIRFPDSTAYRVGDAFYCESDFDSPLICFKTGVELEPTTEKTPVIGKTASIDLHIALHHLYDLKIEYRLKLFAVIAIALTSILLASQSIIYPIVMFSLALYVLLKGVNNGIKLSTEPDGYLKIKGGHPDFLKLFPERKIQ